jgi:D-glycero-alpha-D-manno-heptose-7-phosphate kinase
MIIRSKAPLRLGFAGGGTDLSPYCDEKGGVVLNATINLSAYCTIEETHDGRITINSYDSEFFGSYPSCDHLDVDNDAKLIKGVFNYIIGKCGCDGLGHPFDGHFGLDPSVSGFKITTYNDAPIGSGLGTSSTMVVCILKCFAQWFNLPIGDYEIAQAAYKIERKDLGLAGGKQDQYAASFGGFNYMEFLPDGKVVVTPLRVKKWIVDELNASLVLYFTGKSRSSAKIISEQQKNASEGKASTIEALDSLKVNTRNMKLALLKGDMKSFAKELNEGWRLKQLMSGKISNETINEAMNVAMHSGAIGGKVSGAGGGGFMMLVVDPENKMKLCKGLAQLPGLVVPFNFSDRGAHGWRVYPSDSVLNY